MPTPSTSQMAIRAFVIDAEDDALTHVKQASLNFSQALPPALIGALAGGGIQGIRRLFASDRDKRQGRAPSILNGMLLGGVLGGGANLGAQAVLPGLLQNLREKLYMRGTGSKPQLDTLEPVRARVEARAQQANVPTNTEAQAWKESELPTGAGELSRLNWPNTSPTRVDRSPFFGA